ncbi:hypothetical protein [Nesterenkonia aurantiaca]|uniref:Uncharacterized protein n=1 Tax=Nesterenkonia aurantiaca TaxID=1436010 RepID=A0A4R7G7V7_9MICC|nr:hypothetical protein [Nesterenkonia aurantiaca]TDS87570.1 hypothetical protein EV640_101357 [Nesterenkonia aurantiaca]
MSQAPHSAPPPPPEAAEHRPSHRGLLVAWAAALVMALAVGGVAIWQVSEKIYTPGHTAQEYWDSITRGSGSEALGFFDPAALDAAEADPVDSVLLDGEALARSTAGIENARFGETSGAQTRAVMQFEVEGEPFETRLPMAAPQNTLAFFPDWELTTASMSRLQIDVPGAAAGGIAQITVNGEPVNLEEDSATLRSYVPAVVEIAVDSEWLVGSSRYVVVQESGADVEQDEAAEPHQITLGLEASGAAQAMLHEEVQAYLDGCADQQVLMPAGCPMGINTPNQVVTESIRWSMPEPDELTLDFDEEGWDTAETDMAATVSFDSRHFHDGAALEESHQVDFGLNIAVGASGDELIVAVSGSD